MKIFRIFLFGVERESLEGLLKSDKVGVIEYN